jgi:dienelactone hydrolase
LLLATACRPRADEVGQGIPGTPFRRFFTEDRFGRRVSFFLSRPDAVPGALPVVVWVQGTGCSSLFGRAGDRITVRAQALVHDVVRGRALVLAVEKPGVEFLDQQPDPSNSRTCRPDFLREHTLDRWAEAIAASIKAVRKRADVDASGTLVVGASEGGLVAVRVSNVLPDVSHVASLGGGGPVHLFDLAEYMRRRQLDPEKEVFACWQNIVRDPDSTAKFCWGHPYRQLFSFLNTSLIAECLRTRARLYLAHGTADEQNFIAGFDAMHAELAAKGRQAVFDRVEGADHGFELPGQEAPAGLIAELERIVSWFLDSRQ